VNAPTHSDILRFYVVHKDYENLLESDILKKLYEYTNEMMTVKMTYADREWTFEDFCKKATPEAVSFQSKITKLNRNATTT
jgi:hypothetical protein